MKKIPSVNRGFYDKTITRLHFTDPGTLPPKSRIIFDDEIVEANLLIQAKLQNNLYIDPIPKSQTERVHVFAQPTKEQYFDYIEKLKSDFENTFNDDNDGITKDEREEIIRKKIAELDRTNYQISHCRPEDGIVSINTMKRNAIRNGVKPSDWLIDTTYQDTFRTPKQIAKIGSIFKTESYKPTTEANALNKMLQKILPFGTTSYKNEYCDIAEQRITVNGPIDMYSKIE